MLETVTGVVTGLVEIVASGIHALLRQVFRWSPSRQRPGWVRLLAIAVILVGAGMLLSAAFAFFALAFYVLVALAVIGAVLAYLGG